MNKLLRALLTAIILTLVISAAVHLFIPVTAEDHLEREIGIWNLAILPILISVQFRQDYHFLVIIILSLSIGHVGLGTNYFFSFIGGSGEIVYIFGAIGNYLFALLLLLGLRIEHLKYKDDIKLSEKNPIKWAQF